MNGSLCPAAYPKITNTRSQQASLAGAILYPFCVFTFVFIFWFNKNTTAFLRKRSLFSVVFVGFGTLFAWASTVLYAYLGNENYPCWLLYLLVYCACPALFFPGFIAVFDYVGKVSSLKLENAMRMKAEQETNDDVESSSKDSLSYIKLEPEFSFSTFRAHIRVAYLGSRSELDRIANAKFQKTTSSLVLYVMVNTLPYFVTFLVRLGTNPQWMTCSGCDVSSTDTILIMVYMCVLLSLALLTFSFKVKKIDALRVVREWLYSWTVSTVSSLIVYILYLTDPGNVYADGIYNYRELISVCALSTLYFCSVHQVLISRSLKRKLLLLPTLNRADRFEDVMRDKSLSQQLGNFLDVELSNEILLFLRAVNSFRVAFPNSKELVRQRKALEITKLFIEPRSHFEVNLPHDVRQSVLENIAKENFTVNLFDQAYEGVKRTLLDDGFARFLHKLERDNRLREQQASTVTARFSMAPRFAPFSDAL